MYTQNSYFIYIETHAKSLVYGRGSFWVIGIQNQRVSFVDISTYTFTYL